MRDEFPTSVKETLAKRVGMRCSNPDCRKPTSGPRDDPTKSLNIGVAAHITAAAPDGPRYDAALPPADRSAIGNGIWLCQNCATMIDRDESRYTVALISDWKQRAEENARRGIESNSSLSQKDDGADKSPIAVTPNPITINARRNGVIGKVLGFIKAHWQIITAASIVLAGFTSFLASCTEIPNNVMNWVKNARELSKSVETKPPTSITEVEMEKLKTDLESPDKSRQSDDLAGMSVQLVVRLNGFAKGRSNYLFDFAESPEANRVSLFIKPDCTLWLRVIDQDSNSFSVKAQDGFDTFGFHTPMFISCDVGTGTNAFLRVTINKQIVATRQYSDMNDFRPDYYKMLKRYVGCDIDRTNGSIMTIHHYSVMSAILGRDKAAHHRANVYTLLSGLSKNGFTMYGNGGIDITTGPTIAPFGDAQLNTQAFGVQK